MIELPQTDSESNQDAHVGELLVHLIKELPDEAFHGGDVWALIVRDALRAGMTLRDAYEYQSGLAVYLGLAVAGSADRSNSLTTWENQGEKLRGLFSRQAIPMVWDFAEGNPFRLFAARIESVAAMLERLPGADSSSSAFRREQRRGQGALL